MSNLVQRLLLFILGIPALLAVVLLLPEAKHGATVFVILCFLGGGAYELARILREKGLRLSTPLVVAASLLPPLLAYAGSLAGASIGGLGSLGLVALGFALTAVALFSPFALAKTGDIPAVIANSSAYGFALIYPGFLGSIIVLIASEPRYAAESMLSFALVTFGNDSLAWLMGMTLGRRRGIVAVSPNKSLAGFVGGMAGSLIAAFIARAVFPYAMGAAPWAVALLALCIGVAVILGDLFESAIKRSAGTKDSGRSVPGRGGFLDSLDSLLFAAPVFYVLSLLMGLFR
jgi:phosphatidate cytidylyltransferase